MELYNKIRAKINEVIPPKLEFGCELVNKNKLYQYIDKCVISRINTPIYTLYCLPDGDFINIVGSEIKKYKILGKEPGIAEVLRTMKLTGHQYEGIWVIGNEIKLAIPNGKVAHFVDENGAGENYKWTELTWSLEHDTLLWHAQNRPEVLEFLAEILNVK